MVLPGGILTVLAGACVQESHLNLFLFAFHVKMETHKIKCLLLCLTLYFIFLSIVTIEFYYRIHLIKYNIVVINYIAKKLKLL